LTFYETINVRCSMFISFFLRSNWRFQRPAAPLPALRSLEGEGGTPETICSDSMLLE
jgi:hypothetical protein